MQPLAKLKCPTIYIIIAINNEPGFLHSPIENCISDARIRKKDLNY
jgi:hypothetical protein